MSPSQKKARTYQFLSGDGHWFYIKEMIDLGIDIWKVDIFSKFLLGLQNYISFKTDWGKLLSSQLKPIFFSDV